jgi:peroxiredoxin
VTLGLAFWVGDELQRLMQSRDIRPDEAQGNESWFVPVPATFILARDGTIVARHVDPDYRKRMEIEAVLSGLKAAALRQPA